MLRKLATRALKLLGLHQGSPQEGARSLEAEGQQGEEPHFNAHDPLEGERGARVRVDDLDVALSAEEELDQGLDQSIDLDELSLELSLDHEQNLFQLALSDPLRFLKEHGAEEQALAFEARKEAVKQRAAQRTASNPLAERTGQEPQAPQEAQEAQEVLNLDEPLPLLEVPSLADQAERGALTQRPPREPQKIKKPKKTKNPKNSKKPENKKTNPRPKKTKTELKGSGGDVAQLSQAGSEVPLNATEQSYSLSRVSQRQRGPSRYAGQGALDTTAASARAAIVQGIVESLDELIIMHREGLARREAFFESIQDLIESKQLCYTEADAWWFQLNRVTAHFDEQRVMRQVGSPALEGAFKRHAQRGPLPASRSARRQAQRVQVQDGIVQIRFDALPEDFAPLHEPTPTPKPQVSVAQRKRHRHQGNARLFSSSIPQTNVHTLTSYDGEGSLEASLSLDQSKGR